MRHATDVVKTRRLLANAFPACFKHAGHIKRPLKIGIHKDILAFTGAFSETQISEAIQDYIAGPKYLETIVEGAWRVDLSGNPTTQVTWWQAKHARRTLAKLRAQWDARDNPGQTLGDILHNAIKQAKQGTTPMNAISQNAFVDASKMKHDPLLPTAFGFVDANWSTSKSAFTERLAVRDETNVKYGMSLVSPAIAASGTKINHGLMEDVVRHLRGDRKIEAIKAYRAAAGVGLKEAKDFVESMQGMPGSVPPAPYDYGYSARKDFVVLSKRHTAAAWSADTYYSSQTEAERGAQTRTKSLSETGDVMLVKVLGKTQTAFSMI